MTMSAALDATRRLRPGRRKVSRSMGLRDRWRGDEAVEMEERRHGYFPQVFVWRGHRYDVYAVQRCWTVSRQGLAGRVERYCFRVRARPRSGEARREGTFEIYQDVQRNTWHVQRHPG